MELRTWLCIAFALPVVVAQGSGQSRELSTSSSLRNGIQNETTMKSTPRLYRRHFTLAGNRSCQDTGCGKLSRMLLRKPPRRKLTSLDVPMALLSRMLEKAEAEDRQARIIKNRRMLDRLGR